MNADYIAKLQTELLRVVARGEKFTVADGYRHFHIGDVIEGATESDVKAHLTSGRDFVSGRQTRFPGISSGWNFSSAIEAAGFHIVVARNRRGQKCFVVTL